MTSATRWAVWMAVGLVACTTGTLAMPTDQASADAGEAGSDNLVLGDLRQAPAVPSDLDDCSEADRFFEENPDTCAAIFDGLNCEAAWVYHAASQRGLQRLPASMRGDVESLIVRKGCTLAVFERAASNPLLRGYRSIYVSSDFDHSEEHELPYTLKNNLRAVECQCGPEGLWLSGVTPDIGDDPSQFSKWVDWVRDRNLHRCNDRSDLFITDRSNVCAVMFDDLNCYGKDTEIHQGSIDLDNFKSKSALVRPGCVLAAFTEKGLQGKSLFIDGMRNQLSGTLKNTDGSVLGEGEMIQSLQCKCQKWTLLEKVEEEKESEEEESEEDYDEDDRLGDSLRCEEQEFGEGAACMAYDAENCEMSDWDEPLSLTAGEELSLTRSSPDLRRNLFRRNTIESVSVKPGCSISLFSSVNFLGRNATLSADADASGPRHVTLDRIDNRIVRSLANNVESLRCQCG